MKIKTWEPSARGDVLTLDALERLALEARELAEKATAGSWWRADNGDVVGRDGLTRLGSADYIDDACFIASSRTLVPSLADAVLRLVERIQTLYPAIEHGDAEHRRWLKEKLDEHFAALAKSEAP